jgi:hypothetical protein
MKSATVASPMLWQRKGSSAGIGRRGHVLLGLAKTGIDATVHCPDRRTAGGDATFPHLNV